MRAQHEELHSKQFREASTKTTELLTLTKNSGPLRRLHAVLRN